MYVTQKTLGQLLGLALISWASLLSSAAHAEQEVTLEKIAKVWQARQDRVRSARVEWIERETIPKGYVTDLVGSMPMGRERLKDMGIPPGSIVPPQDTTHNVTSSLYLDGEKLRYTRDNRQWSGREKKYVIEPRITTFNGKVGKTFYPTGSSYSPHPDGQIQRSYPDPSSLLLSPLIMTFRASLPQVHLFGLETMALTGKRAVIDGKSCWELERRRANLVEQVWVDSSRDFVIVRYFATTSEKPRTRISVRYRKAGGVGWVPESWDYAMFYPSGRVERSFQAKVSKLQINPKVESAEFEIGFPFGTRVHDRTDPKSPIDYIVKENGKKRVITPQEHRATYEQLLNSETGEALGKRNRPFVSWVIVFAGALMLVAGGLLLRRRLTYSERLRNNGAT